MSVRIVTVYPKNASPIMDLIKPCTNIISSTKKYIKLFYHSDQYQDSAEIKKNIRSWNCQIKRKILITNL